MRVLICAAGTRGDVHPLVGIAAAMRQRGHDVFLLTNPAYEHLAQEAGVRFHPIGSCEELDELKANPRTWTYAGGWKVWTRGAGLASMRELFQAVEKLHQPGETIVAASYLCFGARVAQEKLGLPTATLHLNVHTIRSTYGIYAYPPPEFLPEGLISSIALPQTAPQWCHRTALWLADTVSSERVLAGGIRRFRRELGLPAARAFVRDWWTSPDLGIGLFPDWWAGEHPDWPTQIVTTGFPFWDRSESETVSEPLQGFLSGQRFLSGQGFLSGEKILVYSPGASAGHTESHFAAFASACEATGYRGLVLTPEPPARPLAPDRIRFESYVPFRQLLPHAAAVVHHAGIGTSAQCLAAGVPQVVVPTLYNQPDTAIRLERLGIAEKILPKRFSEQTLSESLERVLAADVGENCEHVMARMGKSDPIPEICRHLESLS